MWPVPLTRPPAIKERSLGLTALALRNLWSEVDKDRMKFTSPSLVSMGAILNVRHGCPNRSHASERSGTGALTLSGDVARTSQC